MKKVRVVYGGAGTGKTHTLIALAKNILQGGRSVIILSPTHSSKMNIIRRAPELSEVVQTIYAFFKIDYENNDMIYRKSTEEWPDSLLFDEFSLISRRLFKRIMKIVSREVDIVVFGDPAQLNPISSEKPYVSLGMVKRCIDWKMEFPEISHYTQSIYSTKYFRKGEKILLSKNHRSGDKVIQEIRRIFYANNDVYFEITTHNLVDRLVRDEGYVVIASRYDILDTINESVNAGEISIACTSEKPCLKRIYFEVGQTYMVGETVGTIVNGETLTCTSCNAGNRPTIILEKEDHTPIVYDGKFSILPSYLLTAHKAQGMSIARVIVVLDSLFETNMLYTMITRAMHDVKYYSTSGLNREELQQHIDTTRRILTFCGYR